MNNSSSVFVQYFSDKHKEIVGEAYFVTYGKDHRIMKNILNMYGPEKTCRLVDLFFESIVEDKFLQQTGASIGIMQTQIPKLIMQLGSKKKNENIGRL